MGLFEKQIPKYIKNLDGTVTVAPTQVDASLIPDVRIDDIFDPLFNANVRARLDQTYGDPVLATLGGYNELLNNIWVENDGTFGKGMGLLSAFGRSMEKADDLVLGGLTEAVKGLSGQGFEDPIANIFVNDQDYSGRRLLAAAANSMSGFADGATVTEEDFGAEWGLPSLALELGTDVGILGGGLSRKFAPYLSEAANAGKRVSSADIFKNLGARGGNTVIGEVGQLMSDYDDLMTRAAIDITAPGLRPAFKKLLDKIAGMVGAASSDPYVDVRMYKDPSNVSEFGTSSGSDLDGLTTLYKQAKETMNKIPLTAEESVAHMGRSVDQIAEEVMANTAAHNVEREIARVAATTPAPRTAVRVEPKPQLNTPTDPEILEAMSEDIARGEYNGTFSGARGDLDDVADDVADDVSDEAAELTETDAQLWKTRRSIVKNLGEGRTITDAFVRRTNKPYKKAYEARKAFQTGKMEAFEKALKRARTLTNITPEARRAIEHATDTFDAYEDADVQEIVRLIDSYAHPHTEWTLPGVNSYYKKDGITTTVPARYTGDDLPMEQLMPHLRNVRQKLIKEGSTTVPAVDSVKQRFPGEALFKKLGEGMEPVYTSATRTLHERSVEIPLYDIDNDVRLDPFELGVSVEAKNGPERFIELASRSRGLHPSILTTSDVELMNEWAKQPSRRKTYISDVANYIRDKHKNLLDDYRKKHPKVDLPKQSWESEPPIHEGQFGHAVTWLPSAQSQVSPKEMLPSVSLPIRFKGRYKGLTDPWDPVDWEAFAKLIYDSEFDFQSTKSFLEGYSSQRVTPFRRSSSHRWHISPSEAALLNDPNILTAITAARTQLDLLKFKVDPAASQTADRDILTPIFDTVKEYDTFFNTDHMTTVLHNMFNRKGARDVLNRELGPYEDVQKAERSIERFKKLLKSVLFPVLESDAPTTYYQFYRDLNSLVELLDRYSVSDLPEEAYVKLYRAAPEELAYISHLDNVLDNIGTEFISRTKGWGSAVPDGSGGMDFSPAHRDMRQKLRYPDPDSEFMRDDFSDTGDSYIKNFLANLGQTNISYEDMEYVIEPLKPYMQFGLNHGVDLNDTKYRKLAVEFEKGWIPFIESLMREGGNPFGNYIPPGFNEHLYEDYREAFGFNTKGAPLTNEQYARRKMLEYILGNRKNSYTPLADAFKGKPRTIQSLRELGHPLTPTPKRPVPVHLKYDTDRTLYDITHSANVFKVVPPSDLATETVPLLNMVQRKLSKADPLNDVSGAPWDFYISHEWRTATETLSRTLETLGVTEPQLRELLEKFKDSRLRKTMSSDELRAVHLYTQVYNDVLGNLPYHIISTSPKMYKEDLKRFLYNYLMPPMSSDFTKHDVAKLKALINHQVNHPERVLYTERLVNFVKQFVDKMPSQMSKAWDPSPTKGLFNFDIGGSADPVVIRLRETYPIFGYDSQIYERYGMTAAQALTADNPTKYGKYMGFIDYRKMYGTDLSGATFTDTLSEIAANAALRMDYYSSPMLGTKVPAAAVFDDLRKKHLLKKADRVGTAPKVHVGSASLPTVQQPPITKRSDIPEDAITSFRNEFDFLSNFYEAPFTFEGHSYRNAEAAFQAQKSKSPEAYAHLTGSEARRKGRSENLPPDWESKKVDLMERIVAAKFAQNPALKSRLLSTGDRRIVEVNTWKDDFWGISSAEGTNHLGRILEQVRQSSRHTQLPEPVVETSQAVDEIASAIEEQPTAQIVEQITTPAASSIADARVIETLNKFCPDIMPALDAKLTFAQAKYVNEDQWRLFKKISDAISVAPRNATGDYATARTTQAVGIERRLTDFVNSGKVSRKDLRQYYQLRARQAGDVLKGSDFWDEFSQSGMFTTALPKGDKRITEIEYALRDNAERINKILGGDYVEVVVHNTVHVNEVARAEMLANARKADRPTVNITVRFAKGKKDVVTKIQKHLDELARAKFTDIVFAEPEVLSKENLAFLNQRDLVELAAVEKEGVELAQEFYRMLGFSFNNSDEYTRHAMNFSEDAMLFLQKNFYGQMTSEELDDIVDNIATVMNSKGAFGSRLSSRRFRGHYWNLEHYAPDLFSYNPVKRFNSSITGGALANNQFQTYVDLFHNGNFQINGYFKTPADLKKVLYAKDPSGKSGNLVNLELVTFKLDDNGRVAGLHRFDKTTDKGLQQALDDPNTILVPTHVIAHIDKLFKTEQRMQNKFWVFVNKWFTTPFKLGVLMNPGFLVGNMSDAAMKTITAMSKKYGTTVSSEAAKFAESLSECVNLKNSFYEAFEAFIEATKEAKYPLKPSDTVPDMAAMSPKYRKSFQAWLSDSLTHEVTEVTVDGKVQTVIRPIECLLSPELRDRASYWAMLQTLQMNSSNLRDMAEVAGVVKKSQYAPRSEGPYRIIEFLLDNALTGTVMKSSEWIESTVRTAMIYNDLKHAGFAPGHRMSKGFDPILMDVATSDALNATYSAHFDYENVTDFVNSISDAVPFPIFFLKNFYFWMELFINHPQYVDNIIDIQEGLWGHRSDEDDEFARGAKGRGAVPLGDGDLDTWFRGYYKPSPLQSMFGAFSLLNDPMGDLQYRMHPAISGTASVASKMLPSDLTTLLGAEENLTYRPYSTSPYTRNLSPSDAKYNPIDFAIHRANPFERATNTYLRTPTRVSRGEAQLSDFFPSIFQPEY